MSKKQSTHESLFIGAKLLLTKKTDLIVALEVIMYYTVII